MLLVKKFIKSTSMMLIIFLSHTGASFSQDNSFYIQNICREHWPEVDAYIKSPRGSGSWAAYNGSSYETYLRAVQQTVNVNFKDADLDRAINENESEIAHAPRPSAETRFNLCVYKAEKARRLSITTAHNNQQKNNNSGPQSPPDTTNIGNLPNIQDVAKMQNRNLWTDKAVAKDRKNAKIKRKEYQAKLECAVFDLDSLSVANKCDIKITYTMCYEAPAQYFNCTSNQGGWSVNPGTKDGFLGPEGEVLGHKGMPVKAHWGVCEYPGIPTLLPKNSIPTSFTCN